MVSIDAFHSRGSLSIGVQASDSGSIPEHSIYFCPRCDYRLVAFHAFLIFVLLFYFVLFCFYLDFVVRLTGSGSPEQNGINKERKGGQIDRHTHTYITHIYIYI
jgi:hypothetical protein